MKILDQRTGLNKYEANPITKSPGTIFLSTSKTLGELVNEKITIRIERKNVSDVYPVRDMNLRKFLLANLKMSNQQILGGDGSYKCVFPIELGLESGIKLGSDDKIWITLDNCQADKAYDIAYVEDRTNTTTHVFYEQKVVGVGEVEKIFPVQGYNVVVLENTGALLEVVLNISGKDFNFTVSELRNVIRQDDPIIGYALNGTPINDLETVLVLDLLGVDTMKLVTTADGTYPVLFTCYKELTSATAPVKSFATLKL